MTTTNVTGQQTQLKGQLGQVLLATLASTVGFWAWMSIAPLQKTYATELGLSGGQISLMLATPVLVGALGKGGGRLTSPTGWVAGRCSPPQVLLGSAPAVLLVAFAGTIKSFPLLIAAGFYLGVAGTDLRRRRPVLQRHAGTSRRGAVSPMASSAWAWSAPPSLPSSPPALSIGFFPTHLLIAVMVGVAALVWFFLRESPAWTPSRSRWCPR